MTQPVISNSYVGDGTTVLYSFTFPYINVADVVVSIDGTVKSSTTEYSFANATTIQFTTAPATSAAILIKRVTSAQDVAAVFFPGSAVRARDLNDNFVQGLYVSQESTATAAASSVEAQAASANAASAATAATSSAADAATTLIQANAAAASAATAQAASATAQTQANNASAAAAAAAADATAAQASSTTAIATANASSAASTQAVADSAAAVVTSNNAATLVATANTNSNAAVVTANQSATDAASAVNIASSAQSLATQAQSDASAAQVAASASQASATAAQAQATLAADVRNAFTITDSNSDGTFDFVVGDIPIKGNNGVKLPFESVTYAEEGAIRYNNSLDKIELYNGAGQWVTAAGGAAVSSSPPSLPSAGDVWYDHDNGRAYVYYNDGDSNQWVEMNPSWNGYVADNSITSAKILDGSIVNADINVNAAIDGTKVNPDFGSQNIVNSGTASFGGNVGIGTTNAVAFGSRRVLAVANGTTGGVISLYNSTTATANPRISSNPTGSEINNIGIHAASTNGSIIAYTNNDTERLRIDSSGRLGIGTSTPQSLLSINGANTSLGSSSTLLNIGNKAFGINTYRLIGFGYNSSTHPPAFIGYQETNASTNTFGDLVFGTRSVNTNTVPTERMRITSDGKIGVGTISPPHELSVHGATATTGTIEANRFSVRDNYGNPPGLGNGFYSPGANVLAFATNSTERMRLDSSGRLGLSTSVPNANIHIGGTEPHIDIGSGNRGKIGFKNHDVFIGTSSSSGSIIFKNSIVSTDSPADSGIERMKIDANGFVNIGANTIPSSTPGMQLYGAGNLIFCKRSNTGEAISFYANSTTKVGNIVLGASSTTYNTSSDYRLKENVVPLAGATERLKQLPVHRFNFIVEPDTTVDGFLAHEAQTVVPEAVTGEKDGEEMQGIDQSKLVPLLTAALQEAIAKIETLEAKVNALEGA